MQGKCKISATDLQARYRETEAFRAEFEILSCILDIVNDSVDQQDVELMQCMLREVHVYNEDVCDYSRDFRGTFSVVVLIACIAPPRKSSL